ALTGLVQKRDSIDPPVDSARLDVYDELYGFAVGGGRHGDIRRQFLRGMQRQVARPQVRGPRLFFCICRVQSFGGAIEVLDARGSVAIVINSFFQTEEFALADEWLLMRAREHGTSNRMINQDDFLCSVLTADLKEIPARIQAFDSADERSCDQAGTKRAGERAPIQFYFQGVERVAADLNERTSTADHVRSAGQDLQFGFLSKRSIRQ